MYNIKFEAPVRHELRNVDRTYYTQDLKWQGEDLSLQTDWFTSTGVKDGMESYKKEMLVPISNEMRQVLKEIETLAVNEGLRLPAEFTGHQKVSNAEVFKHLPLAEREKLFIKVNHDAVCFDKQRKHIAFEKMQSGEFRVAILVKGLYIGHHPANMGKLASLQLRISQIQNDPKIVHCLFNGNKSKAPVCAFSNVPQTPQPVVGPMSLTQPAKKGRKPTKFQRQNAMMDSIQTQELPSLPADFFNDLDLSALPTN